MYEIEKYLVNDVLVSRINLDSAFNYILSACRDDNFFKGTDRKTGHYVCATDSHVLYRAGIDESFKKILAEAFLVTPDGMPLVWSAWLEAKLDVGRVYGPDLMLRLCDLGREHDLKHFFYGSKQSVLDSLIKNLKAKFAGLNIIGQESPPYRQLTEKEFEDFINKINEVEPDILWLGLGAPKQEKFAYKIKDRVSARVVCCVGAAFDFHAGNVMQAPKWMQRNGLEWFYRLSREPRRLFKRYILGNSYFIFYFFKSWVKKNL